MKTGEALTNAKGMGIAMYGFNTKSPQYPDYDPDHQDAFSPPGGMANKNYKYNTPSAKNMYHKGDSPYNSNYNNQPHRLDLLNNSYV